MSRRRRVFTAVAVALAIGLPMLAELASWAVIRIADLRLEQPVLHDSPDMFKVIKELYRADRELFWAPNPGFDGQYRDVKISINSLGLRDGEFPVEKASNEYRILCIGDSCTFGFRTPQSETYIERLETMLNDASDGVAYEVINGGVEAYSTHQGLKVLERYVPMLRPDLVTVYFTGNDGGGTYASLIWRTGDPSMGPMEAVISGYYRPGHSDREIDLLNHSWWVRVADFVRDTHLGMLMRTALTDPPDIDEMLRGSKGKRRVSFEERKDNFRQMTAFCIDHDADLLWIGPPAPSFGRWVDDSVRLASVEAKRTSSMYIDLNQRLRDAQGDIDHLFLDVVHPTPEGHRLIAEEIYRYLINSMDLPGLK